MARQSRSRPAARPAARSAPAQSRSATTSAAPPAHAPAGVPATMGQPKQPGMLASIASTAAGVGIGSVVGHGMSSMLFGGGSSAPAAEAPAQGQSGFVNEQRSGVSCEIQSKEFMQCLNSTGNDTHACAFYLDQLKACQQAASPY